MRGPKAKAWAGRYLRSQLVKPGRSASRSSHHYRRVELLRLIQVALDRLPAKYGDVLEWKYIEGHSIKEISVKLKIHDEATQSLLARARRAFSDVYSSLSGGLDQQTNELAKS